MRIAIVGAMDSEIEYLKNLMEKSENGLSSSVINSYVFYFGKINDKEIILVKSGIGRVNASILMSTLLIHFRGIDLIINTGIAGGYGNLRVGDIVVGAQTVYGDVDIRPASDYEGQYVYGQMSGCPATFKADTKTIEKIALNLLKCRLGTICTCDKFTTDLDETNKLVNENFKDLNVLAFDMESCAYAQCAHFYKVNFIAIRAISDFIGGSEQSEEYTNNFVFASDQSSKFTLKLLEII